MNAGELGLEVHVWHAEPMSGVNQPTRTFEVAGLAGVSEPQIAFAAVERNRAHVRQEFSVASFRWPSDEAPSPPTCLAVQCADSGRQFQPKQRECGQRRVARAAVGQTGTTLPFGGTMEGKNQILLASCGHRGRPVMLAEE